MPQREPTSLAARFILAFIFLSGLFSAGLVHGASAADGSTFASPTPTACSDPTTCASNVAAYTAIWRCIPAGSPDCQLEPEGDDWWGSVISWPAWSAYQTNARTGANSREVVSAAGSLPLYPYMGSWADGCQVTALTDGVLIIEWQRGSEDYEAIPLDTGETHTIDLVSPQDNAMIEGGIINGAGVTEFRVALSNCNPQPLFGPTFTPSYTSTATNTVTPSPTATFTATNTPTYTPTVTKTSTSSPTPTVTFTHTAAPTRTRTFNLTPLPTNPPHTSIAILPFSLTTQSGSTSGSLTNLHLIQQNGAQDDPSAYVRFQTPGNRYLGFKSFVLPVDARPANISAMLLQVNFKGTSATQIWTWSLYDWTTGNWVNIGNNLGSTVNQWNTLIFRIDSIARYISAAGEIRVRLQSNDPSEDAKIDYQAIHITYESVEPTPTPVVPTPVPTKPRYSFPATYTPTATAIP